MVLARQPTGVICVSVIEAEFNLPSSCCGDYFGSKNGFVTTWVVYGPPRFARRFPDADVRIRGLHEISVDHPYGVHQMLSSH